MILPIEEIRALTMNPDNIRNVCILGDQATGKSTLSDGLQSAAGIIREMRTQDFRLIEQRDYPPRRKVCSPGIVLSHKSTISNELLFVNMIEADCQPEHHSNFVNTLILTDGAVLVMDVLQQQKMVQTLVMRALRQRIRLVVMMNKLDESMLTDGEALYQKLKGLLDKINSVVAGDLSERPASLLDPIAGNVVFGSATQGWAFTIQTFATFYSKKFGVSSQVLIKKLWGDYFYDPNSKKLTSEMVTVDGIQLNRTAVELVLSPISKLWSALTRGEKSLVDGMLNALQIKLYQHQMEYEGQRLLKCVMGKWLNCTVAILDMVATHLPSPKEAQKQRIELLYTGPRDDPCTLAVRNCDSEGPLIVYINQLIPARYWNRMYAFGRIFSGKATPKSKVKIMNGNHKPRSKLGACYGTVDEVMMLFGQDQQTVLHMVCGNFVVLTGIDKLLVGAATVSSNVMAFPLRALKLSTEPVAKVSAAPKHAADLPKMIEGLRKLASSDPLLIYTIQQTGDNILSGVSEKHLKTSLQSDFLGCQLEVSEIVPIYKETVTKKTGNNIMCRSPNRHNRLFGYAQPLQERLSTAVEQSDIAWDETDLQTLSNNLSFKFDWEEQDTLRIWSFGPGYKGPNILVNMVCGSSNGSEIRDSMVASWQWATSSGALIGEAMRGFRMNVTDCELITDAIHRGGGQIIPTARRLYYACQLACSANLMEPSCACEIQLPKEMENMVIELLAQRGGLFTGHQQSHINRLSVINGYLPVSRSFGFEQAILTQSQGQARLSMTFSHWQTLPNKLSTEYSKTQQTILSIREKKGLKMQIPKFEDYSEKE